MVVTELTSIADRKIIAINAASLVHSHETDSAVCQQFASLVQPGQVHCLGIEEVTSGLPLPARPMTTMMRTVVKLEQAGFCEAYCWVARSAQRLGYGVNHPDSESRQKQDGFSPPNLQTLSGAYLASKLMGTVVLPRR